MVSERWKMMSDLKLWICDCGAAWPSQTVTSAWRWDGVGWQHDHPYPTGFVPTTETTLREALDAAEARGYKRALEAD
jgi:hypothetical protein